MDHTWVEGPLVSVAQLGYHRFSDCAVCGLGKMEDDSGRAILHLPWNAHKAPGYVSSLGERFSKDCGIAQEQLRYYLLGLTQVMRALDNNCYGHGRPIIEALQKRTASLPNIIRAFTTLANGGAEDLEVELQGGRPPFTGTPLDIELG